MKTTGKGWRERMENLHSSHRERMRQRLLEHGAEAMHDHEILEMLLYYAIPRGDTNPIAHRLINDFGSLTGVLEAAPEDLMKVEGVGERSASLIKLIAPVCKRYLKDRSEHNRPMVKEREYGPFMSRFFVGEKDEAVYVAALDNKRCVLATRCVGRGSVNATAVSARKIVEFAVQTNAAAIILAHNHPNGSALPSRADVKTTSHVRTVLEFLGIELVDHVIVSGEDYLSLRANGQLNL